MGHLDNVNLNVHPAADPVGNSTRFSPLRFLIITIGSIFLAEVIAMMVLLNFRTLPYYLQTLMDATIMILLIFPIVYHFSLKPLLLQIEKRRRAEQGLREAYDELELRVQERTEELRIVNADLEEEINVRKQAEEALQKSEQRLSRAQEIAHLGSWELDLLNDQLTWSDEVYCIFGLHPQEFGATYEAFLEVVHPDDRAAVDEAYAGSIRDCRDTYEIEHRIVKHLSREVRIVHEKCEHFRDENGQIVRSVGMVHDITERKQAEAELERSNLKLNEILASIQDDFYVLDREWNFVYASKRFTSKIGKEPEDFIGNNIWTMFPKHVGTVLEENFRVAMEKREVQRFQIGGKYTTAWYRMTAFPSTEGITVLGVDMTEQKQAEEALQKNEAMLRAVLNQMPSGVTVRDAATGELILTNARSREILGDLVETTHKLSEYHGLHSDGSYYRSEEWPVFRSITTGEKIDSEEIEFERSSGSRGILSVSAAPIQDPQGQIVSAVAVFQDVTERKKAERELQQLNRTLQAHTASNKAMLRATNETELLNEVCKIAVEVCGHAMIWIGYVQDDEEKSVRPVASAGFEAGYLESLHITWADTERGRGPTGTAIRTGKPSSCRNMLTDPQFAPWREQALQRGYASSIVLPLISDEIVFGAMTIYSRQPDAFSLDEEKLLTDLASDLAHGIEMIRLREAHDHTTAALRESEQRFRLALAHAPVTVAVQNRDLQYTWSYDQRTRRVDEIIGKTDFDLFPSAAEQLTVLKRHVIETGENASEQLWINSNNHRLFLDLFIEPLKNEKGGIDGVGLATVDLTPIKLAEEALRLAHDELELRVQERTEELAIANKELLNEIVERMRVEQQLRLQTAAMEAAANGMVITDCQGNIEWTNPALSQMTGYQADELIGQGMRLFQSGKHHAEFYGQLWETILAGSVWRGEMTNRRKDGDLYIEEQTITPVRDGNGQISHFIAIKQDVTERKLMYAQLEESNRELTTLSMLERQQRKVAEILSQASIALSQTLDIQHVMETILDYIQQVLPADAAFLLLSEGNDQYRIRCVRASEEQNPVLTLLDQPIDLLNAPIVKPFFEKQTSTLIGDSHELQIWPPPPELAAMRNWLGIPLVSAGKTMGMVAAASVQADFFSQAQVELAEAVVSQAAVAMQNAWLFEQVRSGRQRLQLLSRRLVEIQENERKYIARELHDETSQALTSLKIGLHSIEQAVNSESPIIQQVAELKTLADGILESLHRLAMNLRPASLDHLGLVEALTSLVQSTGERAGITARFKSLGLDQRNRLTEDMESSIYRIVQESLTNILRHAKATYADVILEWQEDQIIIIVEDDGIGIDLSAARTHGQLGLVGMQERAEMLGGKMLIDSSPNAGTTLVVEIPYAH